MELRHVKVVGKGEEVLEVTGEQFGVAVGVEGDLEDVEQGGKVFLGMLEVDGFHDGQGGVGEDLLAELVEGDAREIDEVELEIGEPWRVGEPFGKGEEVGEVGRVVPWPVALVKDDGVDCGKVAGLVVLLEKGVPDADHVAQETERHAGVGAGLVFEEEVEKEGLFLGALPLHREEQVAASAGIEDGFVDGGLILEGWPVAVLGERCGEVGFEEGAGDLEIGKGFVVDGVAGGWWIGRRFGHGKQHGRLPERGARSPAA